MNEVELWIDNGKLVSRPNGADGEVLSDRFLLHSRNMIKIEHNSTGTTVHWVMFAANWSSLIFLLEILPTCVGPITLRFFNAGWFEETATSTIDARHRVETLLMKSDVRLIERTYVLPFEDKVKNMSLNLREVFEAGDAPFENSVTVKVNIDAELTSVEQVGENSPLAKIWGVTPVSYPCQTGHSYDRVVSRSYFRAVETGRPVYDHVLAAMVKPNSDVQWMNYQRVIIPETKISAGEGRVRVVCEVSPVDIHPL